MTNKSTSVRLPLLLAISSALSGCDPKPDTTYFVTAGDSFFDDAATRLSPAEIRSMGGPDQLQGFLYIGEQETCIVLIPRKRNPIFHGTIVLHGTNAGSCYDLKTNEFTRHV